MNISLRLPELASGGPVKHGLDLSKDGKGDFFGSFGPKIQSNRSEYSLPLQIRDLNSFAQEFVKHPVQFFTGAQGPDVWGIHLE